MATLEYSIDKSADTVTFKASDLAALLSGLTSDLVVPPPPTLQLPDTEAVGRLSAMYKPKYPWGAESRAKLATCEVQLRVIANYVADHMDTTILDGYRNEAAQTKTFEDGTGLPWPKSNHNVMPSRAIDLAPYPVDWKDIEAFRELRTYAAEAVALYKLRIRHGVMFTGREDWPHMEIYEEATPGRLMTDWSL